MSATIKYTCIFKVTVFGPGFIPIDLGKTGVSRLLENLDWGKYGLRVGQYTAVTGLFNSKEIDICQFMFFNSKPDDILCS